MSCQAWQELLQQHLDGEALPDALDSHLQACSDCAAHLSAIRRLQTGLALLHPPPPPSHLTDRITEAVVRETRGTVRPRVLLFAGLAAAAIVLLAVSLWLWQSMTDLPTPPTGDPGPGMIARQPDPPAAPLRDSMSEGATAVASLTSRTAAQTMDQTVSLLPLVPPLETLTTPLTPMDPPIQPLHEASSGVSSGLGPVADSARRAVNLFLRDLPMGRTADEKKPG